MIVVSRTFERSRISADRGSYRLKLPVTTGTTLNFSETVMTNRPPWSSAKLICVRTCMLAVVITLNTISFVLFRMMAGSVLISVFTPGTSFSIITTVLFTMYMNCDCILAMLISFMPRSNEAQGKAPKTFFSSAFILLLCNLVVSVGRATPWFMTLFSVRNTFADLTTIISTISDTARTTIGLKAGTLKRNGWTGVN